MWTYENLGTGASGLSLALFTRALGWKPEEVEACAAKVRSDMKNRSMHGYWPMYALRCPLLLVANGSNLGCRYVVYGQKPE